MTDSPTAATDGSATEATATDPNHDTSSTADPNALALAMLSQAFAAGFAPQTASAAAPAAQGSALNASSGATDSVTGVTDGRATATPTSGQQLVALLAQDLAAESKGKNDAAAVQSDAAATKSSSDNTSAADSSMPNGTTPSADSIAQSVAQMGVASHFSRDTNIGDLKAPVGSQAWTQELGGHLTWMTHRGLESGSLRVSPEHLGPVEVQITVQNGDASVWFGANHPDTRAALEQALPKLREMFANQGLTLTDSGVSREPPRNQTRSAASQNMAVAAIGSSEVTATSVSRVSLGLIDTYA